MKFSSWNININLFKGEVLGIVGGNGAGKSTLAKIIAGALKADSGDIYFREKKINISSLAAAQKKGILCVFQEINTVGDMTVAENMFLIRKAGKPVLINL